MGPFSVTPPKEHPPKPACEFFLGDPDTGELQLLRWNMISVRFLRASHRTGQSGQEFLC